MLPGRKHSRIVQLYSFMLAFEIDRFELLSISDQRINAKVGWPDDGRPDYDRDEETQCISWNYEAAETTTDDALKLLSVLSEAGCINNDKIIVTPEQISQMPEVKRVLSGDVETAVAGLISLSVDMIDDDQLTDQFFFHF